MPSKLQAKPILDVPSGLPILSCARYSKKSVSFLTATAGLKTSFCSHATFCFLTGHIKEALPGFITGLTESTLTKGTNVQLPANAVELSFERTGSLLFSTLFVHANARQNIKPERSKGFNFIWW